MRGDVPQKIVDEEGEERTIVGASFLFGRVQPKS